MIFENIEFHNVSELTLEEDGTYVMRRFPLSVEERMECGQNANKISTGVELRFKLKSDEAMITLKNSGPEGNIATFYLFRGSIIGGWAEHIYNISGGETKQIVVKKHSEPALLRKITESAEYPFSEDVIRLVFKHSSIRFVRIEGKVEPPGSEDKPKLKYLAYGSSITHGSQCYGMPDSYVSQVASHFKADAFNKGLAGSCRLEKEVADEIALMGKRGEWDFATLCLGINATNLPEDEFCSRADYLIKTISKSNPDKHIFVISPVYSRDDMKGLSVLPAFRRILEEITARINTPLLHYVNGLSLLSDASGLSADLVHPSPDGAEKIARNLIAEMKHYL